MALEGIGGNAAGDGAALDRFRKLRDSAQKRLDSADRQAGLADLIERKQKQLGTGGSAPGTARSPAERIPPGPVAPENGTGAPASPAAAYGRSGSPRKQDAAPRLGRYVDFLA